MSDPMDATFARYVSALEHFLEECLDDVQHRPAAALWNVRRAAESISGAFVVRAEKHDPWTEANPQLDQLVNRVAKRNAELGDKLKQLKDFGNQGAHIRTWLTGTRQPWKEAGYAGKTLAEAAELFVAECERERWQLPEGSAGRVRELCQRLGHEATHAFGRVGAADTMGRIQEKLARANEDRQQLAVRVSTLEQELAGPRVPSQPAVSRSGGIGVAFVVGVAVAGLVGMFLGVIVATLAPYAPSMPRGTANASVSRDGPYVPGSLSSDPVSASMSASRPSSPMPSGSGAAAASKREAPPMECTVGYRVAAGSLRLPQIQRGQWPKSRASMLDVTAGEICIDRSPVSRGDYDRCLEAGDCPPLARGCRVAERPGLPANCVGHGAAERYCRRQGGDLPTVAEWELALRAFPDLLEDDAHVEWASEAYPAPVLRRDAAPPADANDYMARGRLPKSGEDGVFLGGWEHRDRADANLGFRCVRRP